MTAPPGGGWTGTSGPTGPGNGGCLIIFGILFVIGFSVMWLMGHR